MNGMLNNSTNRNQPHKVERKDVILNAFETLIDRFGMDKTTMQEIADAAGISVGTLYNEFRNKDALIDALTDRIELQLSQKINELEFKSESPEEQIYELLVTTSNLVDQLLRNKRTILDYFLTGTKRFRYIGMKIRAKVEMMNRITGKIAGIIGNGIKKGVFGDIDADLAAKAISQAQLNSIMVKIFMGDKDIKSDENIWYFGFRLLVRGLRKD
jgi:AcrR family transcriptional regulator